MLYYKNVESFLGDIILRSDGLTSQDYGLGTASILLIKKLMLLWI